MKKVICFCLLFLFFGIINVSAAGVYKINYVLAGGTNNKNNITEYNTLKSDFILLSPSKAGYTFDGWYSDSAFTKKVTNITKGSTGNKTYYAKWIVNTYSIKFSGNGATSGSMKPKTNLRYDKNYVLTANAFTRKGYKFTGWNTNAYGTGKSYADKATVGQVSKVNGGVVTLYAQWKVINYGITYNLNGGTNNKNNPATYNINTEVVFKNPTKDGYTFDGWYSDKELTKKITNIPKGNTGTKTVYAKWTVNTYTIKYSGNGAESGSMPRRSNLRYDKNYILDANTFKRTGYKFNGWNTNAKGTGKNYADKAIVGQVSKVNGGVVTLYAMWKPINYVITYNLDGGTNNSENPTTYNIESAITLKNPAKTGYSFKGWYSDANFKNKVTTISESIGAKTLYAKWAIANYAITYNLNGGINNDSNPSTYTVENTISLKAPTRVGYAFDGWYKDSKFTTKITKITLGSTGKVTLYAKWVISTAPKIKVENTNYKLVTISFTNNSFDKYIIYRSFSETSGYSKLAEIDSTNYSTITVYEDKSITQSKTYYYKVKGIRNENGVMIESVNSSPVQNTTLAKPADVSTQSYSRQSAVERAQSYLRSSSFSRADLIDQLEFEGYSRSDSTYAVDSIAVNWNDQAVEDAKSYLRSQSFSRTGLIEQLEYEEYTHIQAVHAVDSLNVNWYEQAVKKAKSYLRSQSFSRQKLIEQLEYEEFTHDEAVYGVDNSEADWYEQAVKKAQSYLRSSSFTKPRLLSQLEYEKFTYEQAVYGVEFCGYDWY